MDRESKNIFSIFLICILFSLIGIAFGYIIMKKNNLINKPRENIIEDIVETEKNNIDKEEFISKDTEKIKEDTKIIYESYYKDTEKKDYKESNAPYFMVGKSKKDLEEILSSWEVSVFNEKEVVLKRNILENNKEDYILGIKDNFLAIFYGDNLDGNNLKEITNIPIEHLPDEEKIRLEEGILVSGDEELSRRLEDYGS